MRKINRSCSLVTCKNLTYHEPLTIGKLTRQHSRIKPYFKDIDPERNAKMGFYFFSRKKKRMLSAWRVMVTNNDDDLFIQLLNTGPFIYCSVTVRLLRLNN